jgi:hypothetical protein
VFVHAEGPDRLWCGSLEYCSCLGLELMFLNTAGQSSLVVSAVPQSCVHLRLQAWNVE